MKINIAATVYAMSVMFLSAHMPDLHAETIANEQPTKAPPLSDTFKSPTKKEKSVALSLVAIAENNQTTLAFDYAENIQDGRGITFGIIGFTTGTYDGNKWLHYYTKLNPKNRLAKYIPYMDAIDKGPHPNGLNDDSKGLNGFIVDFHASLNDPYFKQSQIDKMDEIYWNPSLRMANHLGVKNFITISQIFDASIQHGVEGMADMAAKTSSALGGAPKDHIDELLWLRKFLDIRQKILSQSPVWKESIDRVEMYRRLLKAGNHSLKAPFTVTCYGDTFSVIDEGILP